MQLTAPITAKKHGIKHASIARWTEHPKFTSPTYEKIFGSEFAPPSKATDIFNNILNKYDLPTVRDVWDLSFLRSDVKIAPTLPELEPGLAAVSNLHYVGYIKGLDSDNLVVEDWLIRWAESKSKNIFVYLSAKQFSPENIVSAILKTFGNTGFNVIIALGQQYNIKSYREGNIIVTSWIPGEFVISNCSAVISTGTRNTCLQAILAGVGSIMFPGADDELYYISSMMQRIGCGLQLPDSDFVPEKILDAVMSINNPQFKTKCAEIGDRLRQLGGPNRAIEIIERYI